MHPKHLAAKLVKEQGKEIAQNHVKGTIENINLQYPKGLPQGMKIVEDYWKRVLLEIELTP